MIERATRNWVVSFLAMISSATLLTAVAQAGPVPFSGYDINDAVLSGHGGWAHAYTGTITPGTLFVNNTVPGQTALYNGVGNGTLDDGVIGTLPLNTQLFVAPSSVEATPTTINPAIFITLPVAYTINTIELYGGDFLDNFIPGIITGVTVTLFGPNGTFSETFTTSPFGLVGASGPVDDLVTITGSSLDNVPAVLIILSDFQGSDLVVDGTQLNWFSLTEIKADGQLAPEPGGSVPEPGSLILLGAGAGALGLWILRRRRSQN